MADKAIFLDRDNTLIHDPGYINHPNQVVLIEGAAEALVALKQLGFKLVLVTNQSAVARGIITENGLQEIHDRLEDLLSEKGAQLDRIFYCPYHPEGVIEKYRRSSDWRKPASGMLLHATKEMDINLDQSWCIGDSDTDIKAGAHVGCRTILLNGNNAGQKRPSDHIQPDYTAVNLREAANIIKQTLRKHKSETFMDKPTASLTARTNSNPMESTTQIQENTVKHDKTVLSASSQKENQSPTKPSSEETHHLLHAIQDQLTTLSRDRMFDEFSILRLIAGITQMAVLFCLLIALWLLMSPDRQHPSIQTALGFALVLQVMALTFYIMNGRR